MDDHTLQAILSNIYIYIVHCMFKGNKEYYKEKIKLQGNVSVHQK